MTSPTWPELIILMCFGETEEAPFTGIVTVDDRYVDEDDDITWPRTVRVHKSGGRYRVEALDGSLLFIRGSDRSWHFRPGSPVPGMVNLTDDEEYGFGSYGHAIERPTPTSWRGNDFSRPTGPPQRTTYLGRDAWEVELAPAPHKPAPVRLVIDAVTGMQLYWGNEQFGDVFRWTDIDHDVDLVDELFGWDGPFAFAHTAGGDELPDDVREMVERSDAERAAKASALQLPEIGVRLSARPDVWEVDDDGSFRAVLDLDAFIVLERRRHQSSAWESDDDRSHVSWTLDGWDWRLRTSEELAVSEVDSIRRQLAEPRPGDT